jgi:hypothetical protein
MANNLHVSYDLKNPGRDYDTVIERIKQLGGWAKIHYSFWYLKTDLSAWQVRDELVKVTDADDSIYVVDATSNEAAWHNIPPAVAGYINTNWNLKQVA